MRLPRLVRAVVRAVVPAALVAGLAAGAPTARADGQVTIALTPDGEQLASDLGLDPAELAQRIDDRLTEMYDAANVDGFLRSFANATSFASRGVGVDYAPLFHNAEIGFTANLAAAVDGLDPDEDPAAGIAPNLALMAGLSFERWGHPELALYGHGMHRGASLDGLSGSISNVGVHGQYHLFYPRADASSLLFLWSGIHLTAGVEYSRWSFSLGRSLSRDFEIAGDTASTSMTADATGTFDLSASSLTIPIELTTSARIAYFAGIYAGVGVDFQTGKAKANATLNGTLTGTDPTNGSPVDVGTANVTMNGESGPASVAYHILLGAEANVWRLKAFVQATLIPIDGASVALGLRVRL